MSASEVNSTVDSHGGRSCPVCGSTMLRYRHRWLIKCESCGLLASTLQPVIPASPAKSHIDETARAKGLNSVRPRNNAIILDRIAEVTGRFPKSILDVGCGQGQFIQDAMARGHSVTGVEPDANVVPLTRTRTGASIIAGYFPESVPSDCQFDIIVFNDVFEHVPDIRGVMSASAERLAPGGLLVLNCPNQSGFFYRLGDLLDSCGISSPFERMWQRGLPSPHLWYFKPQHLAALGRQVGLTEIDRVALLPIAREGLRSRIDHIHGQSKLMSWVTFSLVHLAFPLLRYLPYDSAVVILQKK